MGFQGLRETPKPDSAVIEELDSDFTFELVEAEYPSLKGKDAEEHLLRWGLADGLKVLTFRHTGRYAAASTSGAADFVSSLLRAPAVASALQAAGALAGDVRATAAEALRCEALSMELFDVLEAADVVLTKGGYIRKCLDELVDGANAQDELRELLVNEDSVKADTFSEAAQKEALFRLFKMFAVGGPMCQSDDEVGNYLEMTKSLYRDLVTVYKSSKTGQVEIATEAIAVGEVTDGGFTVFPRDNKHNVMLVFVDPLKKLTRIVYHPFTPFW